MGSGKFDSKCLHAILVGTVLAINGSRKYYNIYHPKTLNIPSHRGDGAFIGLDDSDSDRDGMYVCLLVHQEGTKSNEYRTSDILVAGCSHMSVDIGFHIHFS